MKKLHDILKIFAACCFVLMQGICLKADASASLTAVVEYGKTEKDGDTTPVPGMKLSIWKSASLQDGDYVTDELYADIIDNYHDMSASEMINLSARLADRIREKGIEPDRTAVTDQSGTAVFTSIEESEFGIYLLDAEDAKGKTETYTLQEKFLFEVPEMSDLQWNYHVVVRPKVSMTPVPTPTPAPSPTPKPTPPPKAPDTSDHQNTGLWYMMLGGSLFAAAAAMALRTKLTEEE